LGEDRPLELAELRARLDAELLDERLPHSSIGSESVRLAARAVEGEHELRAEALPEGRRGDKFLEFRNHLCALAKLQVCLEPFLLGQQAQLLQARDLRLRERLVGEIGQRRAAPEAEPDRELGGGNSRVALRERIPPFGEQPLETGDVDGLRIDRQQVAGRPRRHNVRAEQLAELGHVHLDHVPGRRGRRLAPEPVDDPVYRDDSPSVQGEEREEGTRVRTSEAEWLTPSTQLERA
jgi:hypothetical protein